MTRSKQKRFQSLYEPIHDAFERFCRARSYGLRDYRDLMQDTLVIAYQKLDELKSERAFLSFLFSICVRVVGNQSQKIQEQSWPDNDPDFIAHNQQTEHADVHFLYLAMSELNPEQREALLLFEITGFKIKEIAEIQNVSEDAVKQRLKRGRDRLASILMVEKHNENKGL